MKLDISINKDKMVEMKITEFKEMIKFLMCECNEKDYPMFEKSFYLFLLQNEKLGKL